MSTMYNRNVYTAKPRYSKLKIEKFRQMKHRNLDRFVYMIFWTVGLWATSKSTYGLIVGCTNDQK